jgi:hypothetical protein
VARVLSIFASSSALETAVKFYTLAKKRGVKVEGFYREIIKSLL